MRKLIAVLMALTGVLLIWSTSGCDSSSEGLSTPEDQSAQARRAGGIQADEFTTESIDAQAPQAVEQLSAASLPSGNGLLLTWINPTDEDLAGVELVINSDDQDTASQTQTIYFRTELRSQAIIEGLKPEGTYVVSVTAFDADENRSIPEQVAASTKDTEPPAAMHSWNSERIQPTLVQIDFSRTTLPDDLSGLLIRFATDGPVLNVEDSEGFGVDIPLPETIDIPVKAIDTLWLAIYSVDLYGNVSLEASTRLVQPLTDDAGGSPFVVLFEETFETHDTLENTSLKASSRSAIGDRESAFFKSFGQSKPTWGLMTGEGANGSKRFAHCAGSVLADIPADRTQPGYAQNSRAALSFQLDLSAVKDPILTFYVKGQTAADWWDDTPYDWMTLLVNDQILTSQDGQEVRFGGEKSLVDWTHISLPLATVNGESDVTITFQFESGLNDNFYPGLMIDEIVVLGQPL